jgi:hypothetical protein
MKAPTMAALVVWLAPLAACTYDEPEAEVHKVQQAEIIEVHGCPPGTLGNGEICIDPLEGGGDGGGGGPTGGEGAPSGGGGGGGGAAPYPIPSPKDCTQEVNYEACYQCCDWNVDKVWGERCRRIKNKKEQKLCWVEAENRRSECQLACPRPDPIVTIQGPQ